MSLPTPSVQKAGKWILGAAAAMGIFAVFASDTQKIPVMPQAFPNEKCLPTPSHLQRLPTVRR